MGLVNRLAGIGTDVGPGKLAINTFWGALYELARGEVTVAAIETYFDLDQGEKAELAGIVAKYNALPNADAKRRFVEFVRVMFCLAEARVPGYSTTQDLADKIDAFA